MPRTISGATMLKISAKERLLLQSFGALSHDSDGDEILIGLTPAESTFVVEYRHSSGSEFSPAEKILYLELSQRHLLARLDRFRGLPKPWIR